MDNDLLEGFQVGAAAAGRRRERELQKANQDRLAQQEQARIGIQREAQDRANKLADIKLQDEEEGRKYQQNVASDVAKAQAAKALEQRGFDATPEMIRRPGARPEFDEEGALDAAQRRHLSELPLHEQVALRQALTNERYRKDYVNALGDRNAANADARERGLGLREQALELAKQRAELAGNNDLEPHEITHPDTKAHIGWRVGKNVMFNPEGPFTVPKDENGDPIPGVHVTPKGQYVRDPKKNYLDAIIEANGLGAPTGGSKTNTAPVPSGTPDASPGTPYKSGDYTIRVKNK